MEENFYNIDAPVAETTQPETKKNRLKVMILNFLQKISQLRPKTKLQPPKVLSHRFLPISIISLLIIALIVAISLSTPQTLKSAAKSNVAVSNNKIKLQPATGQMEINKDFSFPLVDDRGKEISKIVYTIESAELRDEIIIKGQKATAIDGRTFLILNLKVKNDSDKRIQVNTQDYVRLSTNDKDQELLAADIHNDPVDIQATSTKKTRLGFPINETDKNLKLFVGEIKGEKTKIDIFFSR